MPTKLEAALAKLDANKSAVLTGALALALGVAVGAQIDKADPDREAKTAQLGDAIAKGSAIRSGRDLPVDVAAYDEAVRAVRDLDPSAVDLLSAPVEPGQETAASVTLPLGSTIVGEPEVTGPSASSWVVLDATCVDQPAPPNDASVWTGGTVCTVRARNDGTTAQRFTALIRTGMP